MHTHTSARTRTRTRTHTHTHTHPQTHSTFSPEKIPSDEAKAMFERVCQLEDEHAHEFSGNLVIVSSPVYTRPLDPGWIKFIRVRVNGLFRVLIRISQPTSGGGSD